MYSNNNIQALHVDEFKLSASYTISVSFFHVQDQHRNSQILDHKTPHHNIGQNYIHNQIQEIGVLSR